MNYLVNLYNTFLALVFFLLVLTQSSYHHAFANEYGFIGGKADVFDGDTLYIDGKTVHLEGVDAPELHQKCILGNKWIDCGRQVKEALIEITKGQTVHCYQRGKDPEDGILGYCRIGIKNLSMWLLYNGFAFTHNLESVSLPKRRDDYKSLEKQAQEAQRNMHRYKYVYPWEWRNGKRLEGE